MESERIKGRYTDYDSCPENPISWRFFPKKKSGKVGYADAIQELFVQGMGGNIYAQIYIVPLDEFPLGIDNNVELLEPEKACEMLARHIGYKLYDQNGKQLV